VLAAAKRAISECGDPRAVVDDVSKRLNDVSGAVDDVSGAARDLVEALALEADLGVAPMEEISWSAAAAGPGGVWRHHYNAEVNGWRGPSQYSVEVGARPLRLMQLPRNYHELFQRWASMLNVGVTCV
jgi:hypothetical protein